MSKKFTTTTADYIEWNDAMALVTKLYKDKKYPLSMLVGCGCFFGLRISDLLSLRWGDILDNNVIELVEKKTGKKRHIKINNQLQQHIKECYNSIKPTSKDDFCFISNKGGVYSVQRLNVILKELKYKYRLKIDNISTHSFRKTFGRRIYELAGTNSEGALVKLLEIFNHSNTQITRRYLGLKQEELMEVYDSLSF